MVPRPGDFVGGSVPKGRWAVTLTGFPLRCINFINAQRGGNGVEFVRTLKYSQYVADAWGQVLTPKPKVEKADLVWEEAFKEGLNIASGGIGC